MYNRAISIKRLIVIAILCCKLLIAVVLQRITCSEMNREIIVIIIFSRNLSQNKYKSNILEEKWYSFFNYLDSTAL